MKITKLYFDGSSDMNGAELDWATKDKIRFSQLVCNHFGIEDYNISKGGCGNHRLVRQMLLNKRHISEFDAVIIQMSPKWRTEYHNGKRWERVMYQQKHFFNSPEKVRQKIDVEFWSNYFRIHDDEFFITNEKLYQVAMQSHCKAYGVPLIMVGRSDSSDLEFDIDVSDDNIKKAKGGHPCAEGHREIADKIITLLTTHK